MSPTFIDVIPMAPGEFGVECREGDTTTNHKVHVPESVMDEIGLPRLDPLHLVEESFEFLLERESNTSIMREFALTDIGRFFPEYLEEMRTRLAAS
jgi:hypothetical protein